MEYMHLDAKSMEDKINLLIEMWKSFIKQSLPIYRNEENGITYTNIDETYSINIVALRELFERVNQREDYFKRYHNNLKMSNYKEIGLIAFWIVKFKPFHLIREIVDDYFDLRVNEEFALYYIFSTLSKFNEKQEKKSNLNKITPELYNELIYTMQYRDVPKEAFGCITELLAIAIEQN